MSPDGDRLLDKANTEKEVETEREIKGDKNKEPDFGD